MRVSKRIEQRIIEAKELRDALAENDQAPFPDNFKEREQEKRISNMFRDIEKYALIRIARKHNNFCFELLNVKNDKKMLISVKGRTKITCSCIDWKIRCSRNKVNCKHILYVFLDILKFEYKMFAYNQISDFHRFIDAFNPLMNRFKNRFVISDAFKVRDDRKLTEEDTCPICFIDFVSGDRANVSNCLKCKGLVHSDCMECWIRIAENKSCVYCGDKHITRIVN
jgi:hypothetical protein